MISSPCRTCFNKKVPKDRCMVNCEKLKNIQNFQLSIHEDVLSYAMDDMMESNLSVTRTSFVD